MVPGHRGVREIERFRVVDDAATSQMYEQRMDTLVTHPIFGYRVTYRRVWKSRRGSLHG